MTTTSDGRRLRHGWLAVTVLAGLLGVANLIGVVVLLFTGEWFGAVLGLLTVLGLYWFAAGALLRTPWRDRVHLTPPPPPPELSEGRARAYIVAGAVCVIAALIALVAQAIVGDW